MEEVRQLRVVARWIFLGVAMLIVQVLLGGITRLTGSGLSITEWKPIMGALPPMSEKEWQQAFLDYQQIAQFKFINPHFSLGNFKFIFFWEWFHRLWARIIGVVFLIPFIYFVTKGYFKRGMVVPLVILFVLGALQGAIGWIMVQSGLNDTDLYVSHIRLAVHFMAAMVLIAYALVFGLSLTLEKNGPVLRPNIFWGTFLITFLICVQLVFGAFMAGLKGANAAPTWPDINGQFIPAGLFNSGSIIHSKIGVHFVHRMLAYLILLLIAVWWFLTRNIAGSVSFKKAKNLALLFVIVQVALGIFTVISSSSITPQKFGQFEWLAELHQLVGMLLLLSMVAIVYITGRQRFASK